MLRKFIPILIILVLGSGPLKSQILPSDTVFHPKRLAAVVSVESALYVGSFTGLYWAWYKDYSHNTFQFFNDNAEWLQMDKVGHATTSYFLGKIGYDLLLFSGVKERRARWYGGGLGFLYLSTVEMFDAYSQAWGFSWGDMLANAGGAGLYIGQQMLWNEQRIQLKWSFHYTAYQKYRPALLGSGYLEPILKDYNGQTYWLSMNLKSFMPKQNWLPSWLNFAFGYGADGVLGGFGNPQNSQTPIFERNRQYYLSLDVDWTRIPVKNKYLKALIQSFSFIKMPFPALEFGKGGTHLKPLYF